MGIYSTGAPCRPWCPVGRSGPLPVSGRHTGVFLSTSVPGVNLKVIELTLDNLSGRCLIFIEVELASSVCSAPSWKRRFDCAHSLSLSTAFCELLICSPHSKAPGNSKGTRWFRSSQNYLYLHNLYIGYTFQTLVLWDCCTLPKNIMTLNCCSGVLSWVSLM